MLDPASGRRFDRKIRHMAETKMSPKGQAVRISVFVISLPDATNRRRVIEEYLSRVDLPWQFFEAERYVSGISERDYGVKCAGTLSNGEVGCFLSHRSLWKKFGIWM